MRSASGRVPPLSPSARQATIALSGDAVHRGTASFGHRRLAERVRESCVFKILIVDDDPDMVGGQPDRPGERGVRGRECLQPGRRVWSSSKRAKPDLLILDVMMEEPDDGLRFARKVRRLAGHNLPILMLTSVNQSHGTADRQGRRDRPRRRVPGEAGRSRHPGRRRSGGCSRSEERRYGSRPSWRQLREEVVGDREADRLQPRLAHPHPPRHQGEVPRHRQRRHADDRRRPRHPPRRGARGIHLLRLHPAGAAGPVSCSGSAGRTPASWRARRRSPSSCSATWASSFGETSADGAFTLEWANCMGMCDQGPAMLVNDEIYTRLTPEKVHADRRRTTAAARRDAAARPRPARGAVADADFATAANELTFSTIPVGDGLAKALTLSRVDIIDMVRDSKLKGRGGAGFPTGIKWNFAAAEKRASQVHHLQRRRGRAGHLQRPAHPQRVSPTWSWRA